jgi:putative tricarboxylic transport membrane protein
MIPPQGAVGVVHLRERRCGGSDPIPRPGNAQPAPLVLAFVLGPMLENNLRKSLIPPQGDLLTFVQRPISAACLVLAVVLLVGSLLPSLRKKREVVALDEGA